MNRAPAPLCALRWPLTANVTVLGDLETPLDSGTVEHPAVDELHLAEGGRLGTWAGLAPIGRAQPLL